MHNTAGTMEGYKSVLAILCLYLAAIHGEDDIVRYDG